MRLVLTWLLGVPLLVGSMVLARAAFIPEARTTPSAHHEPQVNSCLPEPEQHNVRPAVAQQGNNTACNARAVEQ